MAQSEAALSLARALINTSHLPLLLFDDDLRVVSASKSFCAAFDLTQEQTAGHVLADIGGGEWDTPMLRVLLENALLDLPDIDSFEIDPGPRDAAPRRLILHVQKVDYEDKLNARILLAINDVTQVRKAERLNSALLIEQENLLRERGVLLEEMQHRIANSLQIIASILLLKARAVESIDSRRHLEDAHDRVMSVAAVQRHLEFGLGEVDVEPYLTKLCDSLASSMIRDSKPVRLLVRADAATVGSQQAVSLGLVVTELVINALKHAFPDGRAGTVQVVYAVAPTGWSLSVSDDGVGRVTLVKPTRIGLGTSVVEALARRLGARVEMTDNAPGARTALVATTPVSAPVNVDVDV